VTQSLDLRKVFPVTVKMVEKCLKGALKGRERMMDQVCMITDCGVRVYELKYLFGRLYTVR
jgi:hypothetical protein